MESSHNPGSYREHSVLFVDDELENARAFELAFRREFEILRATSAREALDVLSRERVAVVLSDHRMPGMTGTQLLSRVREIAPRVVRVLVTAYGDAATLAQAINDGAIYRYVAKPWGIEEMRGVVRQAIDLYALDEERESVIARLEGVNRLSRIVPHCDGVEPLVDLFVRAIVEEFGFDYAEMFLPHESGGLYSYASIASNLHASGPNEARTIGRSWAASRLTAAGGSSGVLYELDRGQECGADLRGVVSGGTAEQLLLLPMRGRTGLVGAIAVDNRCGGRRFTLTDRSLLEGIASLAGIAVEGVVASRQRRAGSGEPECE